MRGNMALTGGAALTVGILLGFIADRLARSASVGSARPAASSVPKTETRTRGKDEAGASGDVLERYRIVAAL
jgi:hypothetical protein